MKGRDYISIIAAAALLGATVVLGAGALVINQSRVSPQAIASSVTRTPALIERAWLSLSETQVRAYWWWSPPKTGTANI
jgi:hypothetical protein